MRHVRSRAVLSWVAALALLVSCSDADGRPSPVDRAQGTPSGAPVSRPAPAPSGSAQPDLPDRPNLLLIEADDMRVDDLAAMPRTSALIGGRGLTFHNSFAPNPLCCPSRASLLTGRYSHNHGVLSHEPPYGFHSFDDSDTLATRLRAVGYRTALVGKYLNGYGEQPTTAGADSLHYVPPGWTQWWGGSDHVWGPGEAYAGGTYHYFNLTSNVNGELLTWPGQYTTDVTARQTRRLIRGFSRARNPWFLWWTPVAPHHGSPAEPDDPGRVLRPDGRPVDWVTPARPDWVKGRFDLLITHGGGTRVGGRSEADVRDKPGWVRRKPGLGAAERAAVTEVTRQRAESLFVLDRQIARTLRTLARSGQASRTVVAFTSDNGYYLGEHRKRQGKITLHEPSLRVPLLLRGPGVPQGSRYDPVMTPDLGVTLAALAGTRLDEPDGEDLRSLITGGDRGWSRPVVMEGLMPEERYRAARRFASLLSGLDTSGLRLGRWKLVVYSTGETELYDLLHDPLELRSLDAARAPRVHRAMMRLWRSYADCAGAACRTPLPDWAVAGTGLNRRVTVHQENRLAAVYGQGFSRSSRRR